VSRLIGVTDEGGLAQWTTTRAIRYLIPSLAVGGLSSLGRFLIVRLQTRWRRRMRMASL
jgi:hypothetical protein